MGKFADAADCSWVSKCQGRTSQMCPQFLLVLVISFFRWKASATSQYMSIKRALGQMWFCAVSSLSEVWEASNWLTGQKSYRDCYKPTSSSEELELAFS